MTMQPLLLSLRLHVLPIMLFGSCDITHNICNGISCVQVGLDLPGMESIGLDEINIIWSLMKWEGGGGPVCVELG